MVIYGSYKVLLVYGANVNLVDNLGSTALMEAAIFGNEKLLNLLITVGADVNAVDQQKRSVLDKVKTTKHQHIVQILENAVSENKQK
ncbi:MAG: ankyrin repeat domain-containing protein [Methylococcales bacterium]